MIIFLKLGRRTVLTIGAIESSLTLIVLAQESLRIASAFDIIGGGLHDLMVSG